MGIILRMLIALLLMEAIVAGGVITARLVFDLQGEQFYYNAYHQEKIERVYWEDKVRCARKLNGCDKQAVERRVQ
jgi:hypothetical protein